MMGRSAGFWLMVAVFMVGGLAVVRLMPDSYEEHREELVDAFHLPDDVTWISFRSPYRRGRLVEVEGVVQFTPEQWEAWTATLDDAALWDARGVAYKGTPVLVSAPPRAVRWYEGEFAWIDPNQEFAAFWVDWGFEQSDEDAQPKSVWQAKAWRSYCWALLERDGEQQVIPCHDSKHTPPGLRFMVRGKLDREDRLLFMFMG